ncbi:MAG: DUF3850 domain-containing protein [Bdellovibrio sp.]
MNHHQLKILHQHYCNVRDGSKTFEIRVNDRAFQKGDKVTLYYFDPQYPHDYWKDSYPDLDFIVGDVYPIDSERVVFSLLERKSDEKHE